MSNIMQDPRPKLYNPRMCRQINLKCVLFFVERFEVGSLNRDKRKKDLVKITVENQAILKRL